MTTRNDVIFDICESNIKQLLKPEAFDSFTEAMQQTIDADKGTLLNKFTSTMDYIDIEFSGSEDREAEEDIIDDAIIRSLWEVNRKELNDIMLANNFGKNTMDGCILCSLAVLDMSPQDRNTRLYRVNLHL